MLIYCGIAIAQSQLDTGRGMAGAGASTWTGTVQAFDADAHTLTLVRDRKGKQESFTGLISSDVKFLDSKGKPVESRKLTVGEKLRVYYHLMRAKGVRHNVVVRIDLLERGN